MQQSGRFYHSVAEDAGRIQRCAINLISWERAYREDIETFPSCLVAPGSCLNLNLSTFFQKILKGQQGEQINIGRHTHIVSINGGRKFHKLQCTRR